MIKKIKASTGEKILFIFLILLAITSFVFFYTIKKNNSRQVGRLVAQALRESVGGPETLENVSSERQ